MSSVGIVGSGSIGHALASHFARNGVQVLLANRTGPASLVDVVRQIGPTVQSVPVVEALRAEIVVLAVPFKAVGDAVRGASAWGGRIVVDVTNAIDYPAFTPTDLGGRPSTEIVGTKVPGARVVKAFNTLPAALLAADPMQDHGRRVIFLSGDDDAANAEVARLIERLGFAPLDLGRLAEGGRLQQFGGALTVKSLILQETPAPRHRAAST